MKTGFDPRKTEIETIQANTIDWTMERIARVLAIA